MKNYRKEQDCLNCGGVVEIKFCSNCGQENLQIKENFGHVMNHVISDYFHFDHQLLYTLKPLFFRPGKLTKEYLAGHRMQFLHPVKMYIFISFFYFLLLFQTIALPKSAPVERKGNNTETNRILPPTTNDTTYRQYLFTQQKLPIGMRNGFILNQYNKSALSYKEKYGSRADDVFIEQFKHNVPKIMFFMLPLFALILWVMFWKNRKYYVEHLIHSIHLHCFIFLLIAVLILVKMALPASGGLNRILDLTAIIYITWYIFKSLKLVYQRSTLVTLFKMLVINSSNFSIGLKVG
jgi:hypothetical protein